MLTWLSWRMYYTENLCYSTWIKSVLYFPILCFSLDLRFVVCLVLTCFLGQIPFYEPIPLICLPTNPTTHPWFPHSFIYSFAELFRQLIFIECLMCAILCIAAYQLLEMRLLPKISHLTLLENLIDHYFKQHTNLWWLIISGKS